jgi:Flp pilus assembly protein TadD
MSDFNPPGRKLLLKRRRYRRLLRQDPGNGELWLKYARFLHTEFNDPREAVAALMRAERFFPERDLSLRIGDALSQCGEVKKGLRRMYQFLKSNPKPFGYRVLARHLISEGKHRKARRLLRRALLLEPQNAETHL